MRLLIWRWAFAAELMSAMTVMDKITKVSCRVKYPTEKVRPRGAALNILVSRGRWVSESLDAQVTRDGKSFSVTYLPRGEAIDAYQWERVPGTPDITGRL